jgi:hypothetical protein
MRVSVSRMPCAKTEARVGCRRQSSCALIFQDFRPRMKCASKSPSCAPYSVLSIRLAGVTSDTCEIEATFRPLPLLRACHPLVSWRFSLATRQDLLLVYVPKYLVVRGMHARLETCFRTGGTHYLFWKSASTLVLTVHPQYQSVQDAVENTLDVILSLKKSGLVPSEDSTPVLGDFDKRGELSLASRG